MQLSYIILTLVLSTTEPRQKNVFDFLELHPNARTEQRILEVFRKTICYVEGQNYVIQVIYDLSFRHFEERALVDETLFLKNLYIPELRRRHARRFNRFGFDPVVLYVIYNDSLQPIASVCPRAGGAICIFRSNLLQFDEVLRYAMAHGYLLGNVSGFLANTLFGYRDGRLYVFETGAMYGRFSVTPFEEFDWNHPFFYQWRYFMRTGRLPTNSAQIGAD